MQQICCTVAGITVNPISNAVDTLDAQLGTAETKLTHLCRLNAFVLFFDTTSRCFQTVYHAVHHQEAEHIVQSTGNLVANGIIADGCTIAF